MVDLVASAVHRLAIGRPQGVDGAGVGERLQVAVDRGQADGVPLLAKHLVQRLGAGEALDVGERLGHGQLLAGRLHRATTLRAPATTVATTNPPRASTTVEAPGGVSA